MVATATTVTTINAFELDKKSKNRLDKILENLVKKGKIKKIKKRAAIEFSTIEIDKNKYYKDLYKKLRIPIKKNKTQLITAKIKTQFRDYKAGRVHALIIIGAANPTNTQELTVIKDPSNNVYFYTIARYIPTKTIATTPLTRKLGIKKIAGGLSHGWTYSRITIKNSPIFIHDMVRLIDLIDKYETKIKEGKIKETKTITQREFFKTKITKTVKAIYRPQVQSYQVKKKKRKR